MTPADRRVYDVVASVRKVVRLRETGWQHVILIPRLPGQTEPAGVLLGRGAKRRPTQ